ncbi:hypothetical protein B566_EDAN009182 [Ephemera danica]|nr:hypothetical protein B566_EDAN009182 [Ephemera danica]
MVLVLQCNLMFAGESSQAWVTLATNDSYSLGAMVLAHSLRRAGTSRRLSVLVTRGVTEPMQEQLRAAFDEVRVVDVLDSKDTVNLGLLSRPDLGVTFTKLHCWRLTHYSKCVFLDADTLVLQPCDELFDREELSAAPDPGWPDCFNSGVFVYRPSEETYQRLLSLALSSGSFDGGDQGLLNTYFSDWATRDINRHLSFLYNMCAPSHYSYLPAFKQFGEGVKIAHFIGPNKPWSQHFDSETRQVRPSRGAEHLRYLLQFWWDLFCANVHPKLSGEMVSACSPTYPSLTLGHRDCPWLLKVMKTVYLPSMLPPFRLRICPSSHVNLTQPHTPSQCHRLLAILPQLAPYTTDAFSLPSVTVVHSHVEPPTQEVPLYHKDHFSKPIKPIKPPDPPPDIPEFSHPSRHYSKPTQETQAEVPKHSHIEPEVPKQSHTEPKVPKKEPDVPKPATNRAPPHHWVPPVVTSKPAAPTQIPHKGRNSSKPCPCTPPAPSPSEQQKFEPEEPGSEHEVSTKISSKQAQDYNHIFFIIILGFIYMSSTLQIGYYPIS